MWKPAPIAAPPGLVWWRAQLRRRNQAVQRMAEPLALVEKLALLVIAVAVVGLGFWQREALSSWIAWLAALPHSEAAQWATLSAGFSGTAWLLLVAGVGAVAIISGLAVYVVMTQEK